MKYEVLFSDDAEDDVAEFWPIFSRAGEHVARRYVDELIDYCHSFEDFPERGIRSYLNRGRDIGLMKVN